MKKNSFSYSEGSYLSLKATMHKWGDPNWTRFLTRIFYNSMFGAGTNPTGFISESALQNKLNKEKTCQDHYLSPQFMGRMILDNQEKYLSDLETYTKIFNIACSTVEVTVEENSILRQYTSNKDNDYKVFVPTDQKYERAGIKLCAESSLRQNLSISPMYTTPTFFPSDGIAAYPSLVTNPFSLFL